MPLAGEPAGGPDPEGVGGGNGIGGIFWGLKPGGKPWGGGGKLGGWFSAFDVREVVGKVSGRWGGGRGGQCAVQSASEDLPGRKGRHAAAERHGRHS